MVEEPEENLNRNHMHDFNDVISLRPGSYYHEAPKDIQIEHKKVEPESPRSKTPTANDDLDADFLHKNSEHSSEQNSLRKKSSQNQEELFQVDKSHGSHENEFHEYNYMNRSEFSNS